MIIDHIGLAVSDYDRSTQFFLLSIAGAARHRIDHGSAGVQAHSPMHIAFIAESRDQVRGFHAAALAAGGTDNGPPGIREVYHSNYYSAFVIGPDGHNVEAVCHRPEP